MCIVFSAIGLHKKYKLIVAGNRDEFYSRPTARMNWWEELPNILAGKDLEKGGTWLGITKSGRFATLTNFRDFHAPRKIGPSRGRIVLDWLIGTSDADQFLAYLDKTADVYEGYNLLLYDGQNLYWQSNQGDNYKKLEQGIYGVSNALLDTPWPKLEKGKALFSKAITYHDETMIESIFDLLADNETFADDLLPDTGLNLEIERAVSPIFIKTEVYGSRVATIVLIDYDGNAEVIEKSYIDTKTLAFNFKIDKKESVINAEKN
jgi:uncharacterized protein with NRDE domain